MTERQAGYTLVELVVVMAIFATVMTIISVSFSTIVTRSAHVVRGVETDIGGLVGLELLRVDLELTGFGLPWSINGITYSEANSHIIEGSGGTDAADFNDNHDENHGDLPPRPFVLAKGDRAAGKGYNGSDYLVLKGTALSMFSTTARSWSYLNYGPTGTVIKPANGSPLELTPGKRERVIVINSGMRNNRQFRDLVTDGSSFVLTFDTPLAEAFRPKSNQDRYLVYGLASPRKESQADREADENNDVSFPFNRADYYLAPYSSDSRAPIRCGRGTGVLYRGMISQNGILTSAPILDCVADFHVEFVNEGGAVTDIDFRDESGHVADNAAQQIRDEVKGVRVYVLAQQGVKDSGYSVPVREPDKVMILGTRRWSQSDLVSRFGPDWLHYHWKVYTIAVQPKNLD